MVRNSLLICAWFLLPSSGPNHSQSSWKVSALKMETGSSLETSVTTNRYGVVRQNILIFIKKRCEKLRSLKSTEV
jgi:hypothetical protein